MLRHQRADAEQRKHNAIQSLASIQKAAQSSSSTGCGTAANKSSSSRTTTPSAPPILLLREQVVALHRDERKLLVDIPKTIGNSGSMRPAAMFSTRVNKNKTSINNNNRTTSACTKENSVVAAASLSSLSSSTCAAMIPNLEDCYATPPRSRAPPQIDGGGIVRAALPLSLLRNVIPNKKTKSASASAALISSPPAARYLEGVSAGGIVVQHENENETKQREDGIGVKKKLTMPAKKKKATSTTKIQQSKQDEDNADVALCFKKQQQQQQQTEEKEEVARVNEANAEAQDRVGAPPSVEELVSVHGWEIVHKWKDTAADVDTADGVMMNAAATSSAGAIAHEVYEVTPVKAAAKEEVEEVANGANCKTPARHVVSALGSPTSPGQLNDGASSTISSHHTADDAAHTPSAEQQQQQLTSSSPIRFTGNNINTTSDHQDLPVNKKSNASSSSSSPELKSPIKNFVQDEFIALMSPAQQQQHQQQRQQSLILSDRRFSSLTMFSSPLSRVAGVCFPTSSSTQIAPMAAAATAMTKRTPMRGMFSSITSPYKQDQGAAALFMSPGAAAVAALTSATGMNNDCGGGGVSSPFTWFTSPPAALKARMRSLSPDPKPM